MIEDSLVFMMGEYRAEFPQDRVFARNHMWAKQESENIWRCGLTAYAVRLLQDVYFLDWVIDAPSVVTAGQEIGAIESKKAESSLYSPLGGNLLRFNDSLMDDPSAINLDKYGDGWLFEIETDQCPLLQPTEYIKLLEDVWTETQRTIKGQLN